ncbi:hypothetical protein NQZ68_042222, partial [Dissostichus eleginoides]
SSGCWIRDKLVVGGGLSLGLKACWAAICPRGEADEPSAQRPGDGALAEWDC